MLLLGTKCKRGNPNYVTVIPANIRTLGKETIKRKNKTKMTHKNTVVTVNQSIFKIGEMKILKLRKLTKLDQYNPLYQCWTN